VLDLPSRAWCAGTHRGDPGHAAVVAARLLANPSPALQEAAGLPHAPCWWPTAYRQPADRAPGHCAAVLGHVLTAVPAWATSTHAPEHPRPYADATVLTYYTALGNDSSPGARPAGAPWRSGARRCWRTWSRRIRTSAARCGKSRSCATAMPWPSRRPACAQRLAGGPCASRGAGGASHSDLSAYSVFEEAYHWVCGPVGDGGGAASGIGRRHAVTSCSQAG